MFQFLNAKCESAFLAKRNPRQINWTVLYRRKHKKGQSVSNRLHLYVFKATGCFSVHTDIPIWFFPPQHFDLCLVHTQATWKWHKIDYKSSWEILFVPSVYFPFWVCHTSASKFKHTFNIRALKQLFRRLLIKKKKANQILWIYFSWWSPLKYGQRSPYWYRIEETVCLHTVRCYTNAILSSNVADILLIVKLKAVQFGKTVL